MEKYNAVIRIPGTTWSGLVEGETRGKAANRACHRFKEETGSDLGIALLAPLVSLSKVHPGNRKKVNSVNSLATAFVEKLKELQSGAEGTTVQDK